MLFNGLTSFIRKLQFLHDQRPAGRRHRNRERYPRNGCQIELLETRALLSSVATIVTPTVVDVTSATATLGGDVTSDGGAAITERGVVFAKTSDNVNPQLGGVGVTQVVGVGTTGAFSVNAAGLSAGTSYTFEAYATNGVGTSYSPIGTFTTNVAPSLSGFSGSQAYVQGSAALDFATGLTVTDASTNILAGATVTFANWQAGDRLDFSNSFALQHTFTEDLNAHTATLTLSGLATLAAYQTTLQSLAFHTVAGVPVTAARTASITVSDGLTASNTVSENLTVQLTDQPPVLSSIESSALVFAANHPEVGPQAISATLLISDADSANLSKATVQITSGYQNDVNGHDLLSFTNQNGITGSFDASTGTLTLTGVSSVSNYRVALRSVAFSTSGAAVNTNTRTLTISATDDNATPLTSASISRNVTVTVANVAPVLSGFSGSQTYIQGSAALNFASAIAVADSDSAQLSGASVTFTNWQAGDRLEFINSFALQHTFIEDHNAHTATLTLSGMASASAYQTTLQSLTFRNVAGNPVLSARTASIQVSDGVNTSVAATGTISVQTTDQAPVLSGIESTALVYAANHPEIGPVAISSTLLVSDADSANLSKATVQITAGYQNDVTGHDVLSFVNQNGITGSFDAATGTLTLSGVSSVSNYRTALRSVAFSSSGAAVSTNTRTLTITATDDAATPVTSVAVTRDVNVTITNAAPILSGFSGAQVFVQGSPSLNFASGLAVADSDSAKLSSAVVTFSGWQIGDRLDFSNTFALQHTFIQDLNAHTAQLTLIGVASVAAYQTTLQSLAFSNVAGNPVTTARTANIVVSDGVNISNTATGTISVQAADLAPVLSSIESSPLVYAANHPEVGPQAISATLLVADSDSNNLTRATVQITAGYQNDANGHDLLSFTSQNGINGSFDAATGTLTLTGTSSVSNYRTALRSVAFSTSGTAVSSNTRTLTITATDDAPTPVTSAAISRDVAVTTTNTSPVVSGLSVSQVYVQGSPGLLFAAGLVVTDSDSAKLNGATVTFTNWQAGDRLSFSNNFALQHTFTEDLNAHTATLTLSGAVSASAYQATLQSLSYYNVAGNPSTATRTATIQVSDGFTSSAAVSEDLVFQPTVTVA